MKLLSQLAKSESISLFCLSCSRIANLTIVEIGQGIIKLQCIKCKKEMRIKTQDYVQKEKEVNADYELSNDYKIGQNLFHPRFKERGYVIGKRDDSIYINFEKNKLKRLVINYSTKTKSK